MHDISTEPVSFQGSQGTLLDARLDHPTQTPLAYALFAHCFTCSKDYFAASRISRELARRGIAVLRFDFTGLGSSDGDFANTNFSSNITDLSLAADYLRNNYQAPKILIGHSLGGAAVIAVRREVPEAVAVATIAAPSDPEHIMVHFADAITKIESQGEFKINVAGRPFRIQKQFLDDIAVHRMRAVIQHLDAALLVFHSQADKVIGIEHARRIFVYARHPKSFVVLDNADHLLTNRADAEYVANILSAWAVRYLAAKAGVSGGP